MRLTKSRIQVAIVMLGASLLLPQSLEAQRRAGRATDIRRRAPARPATAPAAAETLAIMKAQAPTGEPPEPRATVDFQPAFEWADDADQLGVALTFNNDSLLTSVPFGITTEYGLISGSGDRHHLWRVEGQVQPLPEFAIGSIPASVLILGAFEHQTVGVDLAGAALEFDGKLFENDSATRAFVLSGFLYYDREEDADGAVTKGFSPSVGGELTLGPVVVQGEYLLDGSFATEDDFSTRLIYEIPYGDRKLSPYVGVAKHEVFSVGIELNVPERRGLRRR